MKKSKSSKSHIDIEKEVKEARTIVGRKALRKEIDLDVSERDVEEWTDKVGVSPYWDQAQLNNYNEETETLEDTRANPDYVDTSKPHEVFPKPSKSERVDRLYKKLGIKEKLKRPTENEKEVLELVCAGHSMQEVAELLNKSKSSVQDALNRAKIKLKK